MRNTLKFYIILFVLFSLQNSFTQTSLNLLNPGDGIRLIFYNITNEISGDYFIQQNGMVQLPFIGAINTLNKGYEDIKDEIYKKYSKLYKNPELVIMPLFRINILGEVRKPNIYYVTGVEKLIDLIAIAGGETQDANLNKIYLIRNNRKINIDAQKIIQQGGKVADIGIRSGDQIYVPRKWWVNLRRASVIVSIGALFVTAWSVATRK